VIRICVEQPTPRLTVYSLRATPDAPLGSKLTPGADLRTQIAEAVHLVITRNSLGASGLCQAYACIGARVASVLMKGIEFRVVYGSLSLDLGDDNCFGFDSSNGGLQRGEFHSWFMGRHPDNRIEVVDLAARLYPEYVRDGLPGAVCPQFPAFIWNWSDKLPPGVILSPDLDACRTAISDPRYRDYSREMDALATEALDEILAARSKRRSEPKPKVGRNERCPCGSGRKFKRCCLDGLDGTGGGA
jgi:hypothetical protein